jgi:glycosyltransferase involved in cell wall biosynthesis
MRICHIISGDLWAGAEVMIYRLLKGLQNYKNMELSAILLNEGKLAEEIQKLGIPVDVVDETRLNFFQILRNARKIIMQTSPDVIHSHRMKENILAYLSAKSDKRMQLVCTQHGMPEPLRVKFKIMKNMILSKYHFFILSKYFRYVIAVSEDIQINLLKQYDFHKDKVFLIYNGTDIPNNHSSKKERNIFVIGSSGRLFPIKDYPLMVEIAREVLQQTDKIRFELAGEGPEREKILGLIHKYRIGNAFTLRGFMDSMADFYHGLDLYINTSLHEGLPMSILEAMAHGLPVIAPKTGGLTEILDDGMQGYFVDGRNPGLFAEKCLQLYRDKELSRRMGTTSREKIKRDFSLDKMAKEYTDLYLSII